MKEEKTDRYPIVSADEFFGQDQLQNLEAKVEDYTATNDSIAKRGVKKTAAALAIVLLAILAGVFAAVLPITYISTAAPLAEPLVKAWKTMPTELEDVAIAERNTLYDAGGNVFAEVWTEDRITLNSIDQISEYAINGLIAAEDSRFREHGGIDMIGTARAVLRGGGGASGITQQLVKNLQFYNMAGKDKQDEATEQTYNRKVRELRLAIAYEKDHSKDEILLSYMNTVAFGSPNTYSIEAASKYFFGKASKDLSLAEATALVGTVQNPSAYNLEDPDAKDDWKERQEYVIDRMVKEGYVTQKEGDEAKTAELNFVYQSSSAGNCSTSKYPQYCEYVMDELLSSEKLGETVEERQAIIAKGGLQIKTHLRPAVMDAVNNRLKEDFGTDNRIVAPAAVVRPGTGGVEGFGVNRDYGVGEGKTTINVADNPAGTGSTFKLFTLAAAFNAGYSESDLAFASDCPLFPAGYDAPGGGFSNSNGCGFQNGYLDYQQATAWSSNTWYVTLAAKVGLENVVKMTTDLGLVVPDNVLPSGMSFVLGTTENSTIDMAAAYATFANDGIFCPAKSVVSYEYANGSTPAVPETYMPEKDACKRVMSPYAASAVLKSMRANTIPGYVNGAFGTKAYIPGYDAVGKSGTNENMNYAWGQVTRDFSMFINIYDMDEVSAGAEYVWFRGYTQSLIQAEAGSRVLSDVLYATNTSNKPLNYGATDRTLTPVPVEKREFFTVPSVLGMTAAEAVAVIESTDVVVHVSKEKKPASDGFPSGVIVEQSIEAGAQLPIGTKKEIILYESK